MKPGMDNLDASRSPVNTDQFENKIINAPTVSEVHNIPLPAATSHGQTMMVASDSIIRNVQLEPIAPDPMCGTDQNVSLNDINIASITPIDPGFIAHVAGDSTPLRDERMDTEPLTLATASRNLTSAFNQVPQPQLNPVLNSSVPTASLIPNPNFVDMTLFRNMFQMCLQEQRDPLQALKATENFIQDVGPHNLGHISRSYEKSSKSLKSGYISDWDHSQSPIPRKRKKHSGKHKSGKHKKTKRRERSESPPSSHKTKHKKPRKRKLTPPREGDQLSDIPESESSFARTVSSSLPGHNRFHQRDNLLMVHKSPLSGLSPPKEQTYTERRPSPIRQTVPNIQTADLSTGSDPKKDYRSTKAVADEVIQQTLNLQVSEKPVPAKFTMAESQTPVKKTDTSLPLSSGVQAAIDSYNAKLTELKELSRDLHGKPENRVIPDLPSVAKSFHCKDETLHHDACAIPENFLHIRDKNRNEKIFVTPKSMKILESLSREGLLVSSHIDYITLSVQKALKEQFDLILKEAPQVAVQMEEQRLKSSLLLKSLAEDVHYLNGRLTHMMGFTTLLRRDALLTHVQRRVKHETFNLLRKSPVGLAHILPSNIVQEAKKEIDAALPYGSAYAGIRNTSTRRVVDNIESQDYPPANSTQNFSRGKKSYNQRANTSDNRNNSGQRQSKKYKKKSNFKKSNFKKYNKNQNR